MAFLSFCLGDKIEIVTEQNEFIEGMLYDDKHNDYKYIVLSEYKIGQDDNLYNSSDFDWLLNDCK